MGPKKSFLLRIDAELWKSLEEWAQEPQMNTDKHRWEQESPLRSWRSLRLCEKNLQAASAASMIVAKASAFKLAPPTSAPSISGSRMKLSMFSGVTLPPY